MCKFAHVRKTLNILAFIRHNNSYYLLVETERAKNDLPSNALKKI